MARYIERERPRRINGWVERRKLQIEEEKLNIEDEKFQSSSDFKEITFAITLFGGLLAFLIKLGDYFNNNVLAISEYSYLILYFTVWLTLIVLIVLFVFLILKWLLISTYESKLKNKLKNITQKLFRYIPLFIVLWIISLFSNIFIDYYKDETDTIIKILLSGLVFLIIVFVKTCFDNKTILIKLLKSVSLKKVQEDIVSHLKDNIFTHVIKIQNSFYIVILLLLLLVSTFLLSAYLLTGSYYIDEYPSSNTNSNIITFTIKETGISYSKNFITLSKLETGNGIFHYIDNVTINATHEKISENKLMLGINHEGIWYLNLNTSNLTSGNYMLHAEVTNDFTINSKFKTIRKHDDIIFYIPPKTDLHSYNSTQQE
ncbi:MAG: hypothetical protein OIN89_02510 [Candidatus Methanoperedens sp.]|nr:hypothetical protein [Candidatus Methanoperedens sp.]PKL54262.1 MAG: hypothetical protein CVV36_02465 [Candidatus Methanoperedenaceae archaeon HGW-Methanoperedenaceae-1]